MFDVMKVIVWQVNTHRSEIKASNIILIVIDIISDVQNSIMRSSNIPSNGIFEHFLIQSNIESLISRGTLSKQYPVHEWNLEPRHLVQLRVVLINSIQFEFEYWGVVI